MARRRESGLKFGDQEKKIAKQSRKERKAEQSGEFVMQPKKRHWGVLIAVTAVLLVAGVLVYLIARGNERLRITKVVVADARVPEAVVLLAFIGVGEDLVSLVYLFEFCLGFLIVRMQVRMI